jgi:hypothetical protein
MDWLNWTIRAFTVIGGTVFLICAAIGAANIITATRSVMELWKAKRRWAALSKIGPEFTQHLRDTDDTQNTPQK